MECASFKATNRVLSRTVRLKCHIRLRLDTNYEITLTPAPFGSEAQKVIAGLSSFLLRINTEIPLNSEKLNTNESYGM